VGPPKKHSKKKMSVPEVDNFSFFPNEGDEKEEKKPVKKRVAHVLKSSFEQSSPKPLRKIEEGNFRAKEKKKAKNETGLAPIFSSSLVEIPDSYKKNTRYLPTIGNERRGLLAPSKIPTNHHAAYAMFVSRAFFLLFVIHLVFSLAVYADYKFETPVSVLTSCAFFSFVFVFLCMVGSYHFRREYPINYLCLVGYLIFIVPYILILARFTGAFFACLFFVSATTILLVMFVANLFAVLPPLRNTQRGVFVAASFVAFLFVLLVAHRWHRSIIGKLEENLSEIASNFFYTHYGILCTKYTALFSGIIFTLFITESVLYSVDFYHCYDYVVAVSEACMFSFFILLNRHGARKFVFGCLYLFALILFIAHFALGTRGKHEQLHAEFFAMTSSNTTNV